MDRQNQEQKIHGSAELGTQIRVFFHSLFLRSIIEWVNEFELL